MVGACHSPSVSRPELPTQNTRTLVFYNVENLFDTLNDPGTADDDRTPMGKDHWTQERYLKKIEQIGAVLSRIGKQETQRLPDLIGLCEIENRSVLEDLTHTPALRDTPYGIVHFDGPDHRGIDVALLYNRNTFSVLEVARHRLLLQDDRNFRRHTRDQLVVMGLLDGEAIYVSVNHWPSRSGGQEESDPLRRQAAAMQRSIVDSILRSDPTARILSMGDYNDNPTDSSLKYGLGTHTNPDSTSVYRFYNPFELLYRSGAGTLAYRDRWSLFDQILVNGNWFEYADGIELWSAHIFNPAFLKTREGAFRGYPFRTYAGGIYQGGFSDHFPVYAFLVLPENPTSAPPP